MSSKTLTHPFPLLSVSLRSRLVVLNNRAFSKSSKQIVQVSVNIPEKKNKNDLLDKPFQEFIKYDSKDDPKIVIAKTAVNMFAGMWISDSNFRSTITKTVNKCMKKIVDTWAIWMNGKSNENQKVEITVDEIKSAEFIEVQPLERKRSRMTRLVKTIMKDTLEPDFLLEINRELTPLLSVQNHTQIQRISHETRDRTKVICQTLNIDSLTDDYGILGISMFERQHLDSEMLKDKYMTKLFQYHPDVSDHEFANDITFLLTMAYKNLKLKL